MHIQNLEMSREDLRIRSISRQRMEGLTSARLLAHKEPNTHQYALSDHSLVENSLKTH